MEYHAAATTDDTDLNTTRIYVDADACPVKDEIYKVAARHALPVSVLAGNFIRVPQDPLIERIAAGSGMDAADDWIAERAGPRDIVLTSDIPLPGPRRYRHPLGFPAGEPLRQSRRRRNRAERQAVHRSLDRHDVGGAQSDDRSALVGRDHRRTQGICAARPLGVPLGARPDHPPHPAPTGG